MKKEFRICTLTHHTVPNYGAVLQAYALQRTIEKLGYKSEVLDYDSERVRYKYCLGLPSKFTIKGFIRFLVKYPKLKKRNRLFKRFIDNNMKISSTRYNLNSLKNAEDKYDLFIVGSDQVWNLLIHEGDTTYMLDFINDNSKKGSYAASFGYNQIPEQFVDISKKLISKFEYINIRENTGEIILNEQLFLENEVNIVLDPTLLLEIDDWSQFVKENMQDYILLYDLIGSEELQKSAKLLSNNLGLPLIEITPENNSIGPEEFISLFYNANYILTSSFHGMVFSIIFQKEFYYALNNKINNNNARLINLSEKLSLQQCDVNVYLKNQNIIPIDYNYVNVILDNERKKSLGILKSMLNEREKSIYE